MAKGMRPIAISLLEEHFVLVSQAESILCHNIPQHRTQLKKTVTVYREWNDRSSFSNTDEHELNEYNADFSFLNSQASASQYSSRYNI